MTEKPVISIKLNDSERQRTERWCRVMGYYRPLSHFNKGKVSEFKERKWFCEGKINDNTTRNTNTK